jgi:predicted phage terminase large subunit-like protein
MATKYLKQPVEQFLNETDYEMKGYIPTKEALMFVNFIKEVNAGQEENETPLVHLKMMDNVFNPEKRCAILCHRGIGKTTLFAEYLILYVAAFGYFPGFGKVNLMLYVTDSIENGVKNLRRNVEFRYANSEFLQKLVPNQKISVGTNDTGYVDTAEYEKQASGGRKFTDIRLEFKNNKGHTTIVKGYGAKTGVRGAKEMGQRPTIALLDDLVSDTDAESPTIIGTIENTVYKAVSKALSPRRQKMVWLGTPFNARDPLYKAVESGAWQVSVFPICQEFPVSREDFRGSWEDRFTYDYVRDEYEEAQALGMPANFNQELMLRIMSEEDRLIKDSDIRWYDSSIIDDNKANYNFYITTDFATSEKQSADFSVISVWAYTNNGDWLWVDGTIKRQLMDQTMDDVFRFVSMYKPQKVGIEVSGQQGGFIKWIEDMMLQRNIFFNLASDKNSGEPGIRPNGNKMVRFQTILPQFKLKKIRFPEDQKDSEEVREIIAELSNASKSGFKSKHDDFIDTVSMLSVMDPWKPSEGSMTKENKETGVYSVDYEEEYVQTSYDM